ncbi:hypothetical protein chiPu_0025310 [Chiloscyllium punctatum]|uniref:Uncharacterized protein n=1 Tax=Chiloscyllium punctatum TaxID=137246 RepID=A0A401TEI9_CHIPU|nr:hypothetical protein [Chiloscyllium punctatum]
MGLGRASSFNVRKGFLDSLVVSPSPGAVPGFFTDQGLPCDPVAKRQDHDHVSPVRETAHVQHSHPFLKQCIELEQQFDFLKDLVASVPDMQGDNEDNHMEGDKTPRR